ncbi:hypothetical protein HRG_013840 [Hirsutella rhossiliensis]
MSSSPSADSSAPHLRKPLATGKGAGGDMSMMFFAQPDCPARFAHQDEHRIRGLNAEAIARVLLPVPSWLLESDLNLSIYGQPVVDTDWSEQWFFMSGRVHPYALSWEVERRDGLEAGPDDTILYTVPALIVRDQGYQPVLPRSWPLAATGPGLDLLRRDFLPNLGPDQLRCCGFVRLTTYIALACRTGFHIRATTLRGLCYLSVYVNPWAVLCKKIAEKPNSSFLPGVPLPAPERSSAFSTTALCSPRARSDYVFIIVPDSWTFVDRPSAAAAASAPSLRPLGVRPNPPPLPSIPSVPPSIAPALADTPMKRARFLQQQYSPLSSSSNTVGSAAPPPPPPAAFPSRPDGAPPFPLRRPARIPLNSIVASTSDPPARPLRYRMQK